ncbi:MAG: hypothetical protein Q7U38_12660 [Methylobacter sp.]|nr:hypothetical protein [Methylobacter sp.]MDP2097694.1 hypothetical protein [Methylobacter sp.]MDP2428827.1 hypothetical protein [Methylobacter sp.]MDP3054030.1 hypothetical protein [Methylobacter sp.]MDP3361905.1 hypothetical protein [Methylobacter sp.]
MKTSTHILFSMALLTLAACSIQEVKQDTKTAPATDTLAAITGGDMQGSGQNPPLTQIKGGKILNLVRIMDGGACKNDFQGTKGVFLVYADPDDIERIKREQGTQVFAEFESEIQHLSTDALQDAINATNLAEDPFSLGADEAQEKLGKQLSNNFRNSIAQRIKDFQQKTGLTIDVTPFAPSLFFYQQGCDATQLEPEN